MPYYTNDMPGNKMKEILEKTFPDFIFEWRDSEFFGDYFLCRSPHIRIQPNHVVTSSEDYFHDEALGEAWLFGFDEKNLAVLDPLKNSFSLLEKTV